jgi:hypothetical protein
LGDKAAGFFHMFHPVMVHLYMALLQSEIYSTSTYHQSELAYIPALRHKIHQRLGLKDKVSPTILLGHTSAGKTAGYNYFLEHS